MLLPLTGLLFFFAFRFIQPYCFVCLDLGTVLFALLANFLIVLALMNERIPRRTKCFIMIACLILTLITLITFASLSISGVIDETLFPSMIQGYSIFTAGICSFATCGIGYFKMFIQARVTNLLKQLEDPEFNSGRNLEESSMIIV